MRTSFPATSFFLQAWAGIFPKGIVIGEIQEIIEESGAITYAKITPAVDFRRIEEVLIITEETSAEELARIQEEKRAAEQEKAQETAAEEPQEPEEGAEDTDVTEGGEG